MGTTTRRPWVPPRWFVRTAWAIDRWRYRRSGGRRVLARPGAGTAGRMRLRTRGRRSGEERAAIVSYIEAPRGFVTLAMNGWGDAPPAWWLNLLACPDAEVDTADGPRRVHARAAEGEERDRIWTDLRGVRGWGDVEAYAAHRVIETPVVVLEPR